MSKFKIDCNKDVGKKNQNVFVAIEPELYRWVKVSAAINEITIANVLNQAIEFAKKNSERISI